MSTVFGTTQLKNFEASLDARSQASVASAIERITEIKKRGGKVMVVTGSGPNIHEGVTTLLPGRCQSPGHGYGKNAPGRRL